MTQFYIRRQEPKGKDSYLHFAIDSGGMSRHWTSREYASTWDSHPSAIKFMAERLAETAEDISKCYVERGDDA